MTLLLAACAPLGTSSKMDFLPLTDVRVDPIVNQQCLSDHVHTFYGATVTPRCGRRNSNREGPFISVRPSERGSSN